ncbi:hypothetical protein B0H13DRAFT_2365861 [Mycena leptocephala]|nr:hypothetical protein B0H13DRAFT_2365861 [Mycena leptocephala]
MTSHSTAVSPTTPSRWPRPMIPDAGWGVSNPGTPLVSPLTPLPAEVLDLTRKGTFGPEDPHPREGTTPENQGRSTGMLECSSTLLLAMIARGTWKFHVSDAQISAELTKYGEGVHREIQQDPDTSDESEVSEGWHPTPPVVAPVPRRSVSAPVLEYTPVELEEYLDERLSRMVEPTPLPNICTEDTNERLAADKALFPQSMDNDGYQVRVAGQSGASRPPWALTCESPESSPNDTDLPVKIKKLPSCQILHRMLGSPPTHAD